MEWNIKWDLMEKEVGYDFDLFDSQQNLTINFYFVKRYEIACCVRCVTLTNYWLSNWRTPTYALFHIQNCISLKC